MRLKRKGYTLIELAITVVILGSAVAAIAIPRLRWDTYYRMNGDTVARRVMTSMRRARQMAINDAVTNTDGYGVRRSGRTFEIVNLSTGRAVDNSEFIVDSKIRVGGGSQFNFGTLGELKSGSSTRLTIRYQRKRYNIRLTRQTGMIKCQESG